MRNKNWTGADYGTPSRNFEFLIIEFNGKIFLCSELGKKHSFFFNFCFSKLSLSETITSSPLFYEWCSCRSSSGVRGTASRSSSWACSSSGPSVGQPAEKKWCLKGLCTNFLFHFVNCLPKHLGTFFLAVSENAIRNIRGYYSFLPLLVIRNWSSDCAVDCTHLQ